MMTEDQLRELDWDSLETLAERVVKVLNEVAAADPEYGDWADPLTLADPESFYQEFMAGYVRGVENGIHFGDSDKVWEYDSGYIDWNGNPCPMGEDGEPLPVVERERLGLTKP